MMKYEATIKSSGRDKEPTGYFQHDGVAMNEWIDKTLAVCQDGAYCEVFENTRTLIRTTQKAIKA